jgi:2',3'-cyclic-nucleotide 2'-phosphodiesterase
MRLLCIGDVVGGPGRRILQARLAELVRDNDVDLVVANGENLAGGVGVTAATAEELFAAGVGVITGGNHTWKHKEAHGALDRDARLLRPYNYPAGAPGRGLTVVETRRGPVAVLNLIGRIFMDPVDCPFAAADRAFEELGARARVVAVDMHCEATSEKRAMGWHLCGRATVVYGTHTHVPTADEEVLPGGTAYVTDLGMTGPYDSVIGTKKELVLRRFRSMRPVAFDTAKGDLQLRGVVVDVDESTGRASGVRRLKVCHEAKS